MNRTGGVLLAGVYPSDPAGWMRWLDRNTSEGLEMVVATVMSFASRPR
jgi:hypothetical protein